MFIHDRTKELSWKIQQLEAKPSGDYSCLGADIEALEPDMDSDGQYIGRRSWRIQERTQQGAQKFGLTVRDSWMPFLGGTGGASASVWGLKEVFSTLTPDIPWVIPAMLGGLVGWKAGEWSNRGTIKTIELISSHIRAFNDRYYFRF